MRRTTALIAGIGIVAALTGCTASSSQADCDAPFSSGDSSAAVSATGDFGAKPDVSVPTPLKADGTQVSTLIEGSGAPLEKGQLVTIDYTLVNGADGTVLETSPYDGSSTARFGVGGAGLVGLNEGLLCTQVGSRVAIAIAPEDGFGQSSSQLGISEDDTLVLVADVREASLARANGAVQPAPDGFPTVTLGDDGRPGLAKPSGDAPSDLRIAQLKKGDGDVVAEGDQVVVAYTGWQWSDGKVFDSSWEKGAPAVFTAADGSTTQGGVIAGFADALIGQPVGSQVIAVIPPDQGYGDQGSPQGGIPGGATLIFVADILGKV
ncbi:peptidylprolyl isomerase [Rathayibacter sp. AY1D2]|uniref:FKBP-type peptidyl-prolyl cis-trans isomerase n=1 Tax=unclassified Rathayibacter TaxID=2609250 RepID=UPI000CE90DCF|nr:MULTISPECIES: FKBP-type peptidyl-prolyl cis-trans isomerase [unclassified Rathayibacter]PPF37755.1 peptidylprolyl isomerase [Rathayibacter sp. AY1A3]PPI17707.1 peptidylprolyl isomerase [Rathayibacter sp. AY1D2]PPI37279.1 peptidylprolyl isomerase [Rathayibacter sp. RFBD1]PPI54387.1 peptidylprolyl isomerase [Rathayibacter sp. TRS19]QHF20261.1 peptidylprolyl isomerase [Rathayibacter sp. VKM Ac-2762]